MDVVWLLDMVLWQKSTTGAVHTENSSIPIIFNTPTYLFFLKSIRDFGVQMGRDINRFLFAIILGLDPGKLYKRSMFRRNAHSAISSIFDAYPELRNRLLFSHDERKNDYDCTCRFIAGAKTPAMGSRRVCENFRSVAWKLFGLKPPAVQGTGWLHYEKPPNRVVLLYRHVNRMISNKEELVSALRNASMDHKFELEINTTERICTAEDHVVFFRRVGVLVTPHKSRAMGAMWMPRYSSLIEIVPPSYADFSQAFFAIICSLRYYRLNATVPEDLREEIEEKRDMESYYTNFLVMKNKNITVNVKEIVESVLLSLRQIVY